MEANRPDDETRQGETGERSAEEAIWERRAREEADAAAREAGRIGGPGSPEPVDPEEQPLAEAGGGEAEGFEQAERDLVEHASHGDPAPDPTDVAPEPEPEREDAERGGADREHSTAREDERETT